MELREATDRLSACPNHEDIAEATGVGVQSIRQARLDPSNVNYRKPPPQWREAVAQLAEEGADRLRKLAAELRREGQS